MHRGQYERWLPALGQMFASAAGILLVICSSCSLKNTENQDWVVRVHNHYLMQEELAKAVPLSLSPEDSAKAADLYINQWLKDHVVLVQAELNLPPERMDFEQQLRDYRNSLVVYSFERELIKQKLDTVVTEAEIAAYYKEHPRNFELKDFIVRVRFIKVASDAPKQAELEMWIDSEADDDYYKLIDYSKQFAEFGFFDEERWLYLDELLTQVPVRIADKAQFLSQNKLVKLSEGDYLYLLKILDYQMKDGISPLELVKQDIRNIIVNKRKREFIIQMRKDLMDQALKNNDIEYRR